MSKVTTCASVALLAVTMSASAAFGQATIQVGSVEGSGTVEITLSTGGTEIVGTENVIMFGPEVQITGCTVNPDINLSASAGTFSPRSCDDDGSATPCESLLFLVLGFHGSDVLPDGVTLYTCDVVVVSGTDPGDYDLKCADAEGVDPKGSSIDTGCASGTVTVLDVPVVNLNIGSTALEPGRAGQIEVRLELLDSSASVAATENVISFAPGTQVSRCQVTPDIDRSDSAFSFSPAGCAPGVNCESMSGRVLSLSNRDPLADGTLLYTCDVVSVSARSASATASGSSAGTAAGVFPLICSEPGSSDPAGVPLSTTCSNGEVEVIEPTPIPTVTNTPTEVPTVHATDTPEPTASHTVTSVAPPTRPPANDDGCSVAAAQSSDSIWMLLLPMIALTLVRRLRE